MGIFLPGQFEASKLECSTPPPLTKSNNKHLKLENTSTQVCWSSAWQPSATPHLPLDQSHHCTCDTNTAIELLHYNPQSAKTQTETLPNLPQKKHQDKRHSRVSISVLCKELVLRDVSQLVLLLFHLPLKKRLAQLRRASGNILVRQRDIESSQRDAALQTTTEVAGEQAEVWGVRGNLSLWVSTAQRLDGSRDAV